jgi:tetratricopeptide (TPR) repeat protein
MSADLSVYYRYMLGYCHAELGEFIEAVARGQDAVRIAEEIEQPYACALAHVWLGRIHFVKGEFAQASRDWKAGFDIVEARQLGVPVGAGFGYAQVMSGDIANGLSLLETDVARLLATKWFGRKGVVSAWLGEAYMMAGRPVEAADAAQRGLALVRETHQRGYEAMTLRVLGEIAMRGSRPDAAGAEAFYRQALGLAETLGMRPLIARCYLGLGTVYLHLDKRPAARQHLATARAMLAEMGMRLWLQQSEETLQALV